MSNNSEKNYKTVKKIIKSLTSTTSKKEIKKALEVSEEKYKTAFEYTGTGMMVLEDDMTISLINQKIVEMTGYTHEEIEGKRKWTELVWEQDVKLMMEYHELRRIDPDKVPTEYEFKFRHKNGVYRDTLINVSMIPGTKKSLVSLIDITERKQMERKLRRSEERLRSIYSASPLGIAIFNSKGRVIDMNSSFKRMFGLPNDIDRTYVKFTLFEHIIEMKNNKSKLIHSGGMNFESKNDFKFVKTKDVYKVLQTGARFLDWHITPLGIETGIASMFLAQVQDITERKRNEEAKLDKARKVADEANRLVDGLKKEIYQKARFHNMISRSPDMQKIFNILPEISQTSTTILITGETGTGKELIARSIHELGPRKTKPFIPINCGALPENLIESELFGYKKGAFTDAKKDKPGKFALAEGGTLFLDEIGDVSIAMQVKLLRVLQEKVFEPLGATEPISVDVRVIAATNRNLPKMVKNGEFREDLYYRINVLNIALPALRDRRSDIPLLCDYYISLFNARYAKNIQDLSNEALDIILAYDYPGNIRELENILEHAFIFCKDGSIEPRHLPPEITKPVDSDKKTENILDQINSFDELEKIFIKHILSSTGGSRINAAKKLGIHKATLFRKMKNLGIDDA